MGHWDEPPFPNNLLVTHFPPPIPYGFSVKFCSTGLPKNYWIFVLALGSLLPCHPILPRFSVPREKRENDAEEKMRRKVKVSLVVTVVLLGTLFSDRGIRPEGRRSETLRYARTGQNGPTGQDGMAGKN